MKRNGKTSHHHEQLTSVIMTATQEVLARGLGDPRLDGCMLTVTGIDLSPDMKNATLRISVLPAKSQARAMAALNHATSALWRRIAEKVSSRSMPALRFTLDTSLKKQAAVMEALAKVVADRPASADDPQAAPGSGPAAAVPDSDHGKGA